MPEKSFETLRELIGWESPAFHVDIEAGRVADFATAVHDDDPVFRNVVEARSREMPDIPVPITFFGSLFYLDKSIHEPDLGFRTEDKLHGEQHFEFERTVTVGETLSGKTTLADVSQKEKKDGGILTVAELQTEYRDEDGELVVTATKIILEVSSE